MDLYFFLLSSILGSVQEHVHSLYAVVSDHFLCWYPSFHFCFLYWIPDFLMQLHLLWILTNILGFVHILNATHFLMKSKFYQSYQIFLTFCFIYINVTFLDSLMLYLQEIKKLRLMLLSMITSFFKITIIWFPNIHVFQYLFVTQLLFNLLSLLNSYKRPKQPAIYIPFLLV